MDEVDPFTQVHDRLLTVLTEDAEWSAAFRPGNVAGGGSGGAFRAGTRRLPYDFGAFRIVPMVGGRFALAGTSTGYLWVQNYALQITTDSPDFTDAPDAAYYTKRLFWLKWITLRALGRARERHGKHLGLSDLLVDVQPIDTIESNDPSELNKGTRNWTAVVGVSAQLQIPRTEFV